MLQHRTCEASRVVRGWAVWAPFLYHSCPPLPSCHQKRFASILVWLQVVRIRNHSGTSSDDSPSPSLRSSQPGSAPRPCRRKRQPARNNEFVSTEAACQQRHMDAKRSPSPHSMPPTHAASCARSELDDCYSLQASHDRRRCQGRVCPRGRWSCRPPAVATTATKASAKSWDDGAAVTPASRATPAAWMAAARAAAQAAKVKASARDASSPVANGTGSRGYTDMLVDGVVEVRVEWKNRDAIRGIGSQGDVLVARCADRDIAKVRLAGSQTMLVSCTLPRHLWACETCLCHDDWYACQARDRLLSRTCSGVSSRPLVALCACRACHSQALLHNQSREAESPHEIECSHFDWTVAGSTRRAYRCCWSLTQLQG